MATITTFRRNNFNAAEQDNWTATLAHTTLSKEPPLYDANLDSAQNSIIQELLQLQSEQRTAHLTANAKKLVDLFADEFIRISNGKIARPLISKASSAFKNISTR